MVKAPPFGRAFLLQLSSMGCLYCKLTNPGTAAKLPCEGQDGFHALDQVNINVVVAIPFILKL
jgi:hypothetical protein